MNWHAIYVNTLGGFMFVGAAVVLGLFIYGATRGRGRFRAVYRRRPLLVTALAVWVIWVLFDPIFVLISGADLSNERTHTIYHAVEAITAFVLVLAARGILLLKERR